MKTISETNSSEAESSGEKSPGRGAEVRKRKSSGWQIEELFFSKLGVGGRPRFVPPWAGKGFQPGQVPGLLCLLRFSERDLNSHAGVGSPEEDEHEEPPEGLTWARGLTVGGLALASGALGVFAMGGAAAVALGFGVTATVSGGGLLVPAAAGGYPETATMPWKFPPFKCAS